MLSFTAAAFLCHCLQATHVPIKSGTTVLLVGDSLAVGMTNEVRYQSKSSGFNTAVHAIGGTSTHQWLHLITADVKKYRPTLVLISLGTNDSARNFDSTKRSTAIYKTMSSLAGSTGARVVWIGPPALPQLLSNSSKVKDAIKQTMINNYFDSDKIVISMSHDKIHPTTAGYTFWTRELWKWLKCKCII
jgi:lysophospholipase L1-like esterase